MRPSSRSTAVDEVHRTRLTEVLADNDEAILRAYRRRSRRRRGLAAPGGARRPVRTRGWSIPCSSAPRRWASAWTSLLAGVDELLSGLERDPDAAVSGRVFKIERTASGERVAYVRLFAGTLRPRQRVRVGDGEDAKPTSIKVFAPAGAPRRDTLAAGEMATVRGLGAVRVGDAIGEPPPGDDATARFPRPALEAVVFAAAAGRAPARSAQRSRSSPSRIRSSTSARTTTATRSPSRSTARCRRRSSRRRSSASTASPPTSARRRPCASSDRRASARPRRSSRPRPTRTSPAAARR